MSNPTPPHTPASVDPSLLEDTITFIKRFVIFQDEAQYRVLALWVIHTHVFDAFYATPYLYVKSAEKQSGKTRVIEVAALLAHNPVQTASASPGALYAMIGSENKPTVFLDEVDAVFTGASNEDLRGMLNSGYKKNGTVMRQAMVEGGERIAVPYSTFCPKLLAGIENGALPDTIADRSIIFDLKRKKSGEEVERMVERKVAPDAEALKTRMADWADANLEAVTTFEPKMMDTISDRSYEIAEPLLQVASRFRGAMAQTRKDIENLLAEKPQKLSPGAEALTLARTLAEDGRKVITSGELAEAMDVSTKRLGILLAPYGITPGTKRLGQTTVKGYYVKDFQDAWERYL